MMYKQFGSVVLCFVVLAISLDKQHWESNPSWTTTGEACGWNVSINKLGR